MSKQNLLLNARNIILFLKLIMDYTYCTSRFLQKERKREEEEGGRRERKERKERRRELMSNVLTLPVT